MTGLELLKIAPSVLGMIEKIVGYFKPVPEQKWVDDKYPETSGLQKEWDEEGYQLVWSLDNKVNSRVEQEGYEIVKKKSWRKIFTFHLKDKPDNKTLLAKKKNGVNC